MKDPGPIIKGPSVKDRDPVGGLEWESLGLVRVWVLSLQGRGPAPRERADGLLMGLHRDVVTVSHLAYVTSRPDGMAEGWGVWALC